MQNGLYLFVSTRDRAVRDKCASLRTDSFHEILSRSEENWNTFFFSTHSGRGPQYLWVVNDQGDYSVDDKLQSLLKNSRPKPDSESFVNFAHVVGKHFVADSGFWALQHHYYHGDENTFICSNNVFVVASILGSRLSETSFFEYLFFNWPVDENTWFEGIQVLGPGQAIVYDSGSHRLTVTPRVDLYEELTRQGDVHDLATAADSFFENVARVIRDRKAVIGLSAGSDSRTILSGLMKYKLLDHAASFGREDFIETRAIKALSSALGFKSVVYQTPDLFTDWERSFYRGNLVTSGLLNPLRVHYVKYYNGIDGDAWFEGFLGSEIVKGEIAPAAMAAKCHVEAVRDKLTVGEVLKNNYPSLPQDLRSRMETYLAEKHSSTLKPIDTPDGVRAFARFIFHSDPSKCFGPLMILAGQKMKTYYPYLSPRIIRALGPQCGLLRSALRSEFAGHLKCLVPQSQIVKRLDKRVYESRLDRLVSYKEALELPMPLLYPLWGLRRARDKVATSRYHFGQTDAERAHGNARKFAEENAGVIANGVFGEKPEGGWLLKERCQYIGLKQIISKSPQALIADLTAASRT